MALADKGGEKNRRFAGQARMGPKFCGFSGRFMGSTRELSEIEVQGKAIPPLDRMHRSAQGPEQKSFLEVAGKPDPKFVAER